MTKKEFISAQKKLGMNNRELGEALGLTVTAYQCRQVDNIVNGTTLPTPVMARAIECLLWRRGLIK